MLASAAVGRRLLAVAPTSRWASTNHWVASAEQVAKFHRDGFIVAKGFLDSPEVQLVKEALEQDATLVENEIVLNDDNEGSTRLALWSDPGDGTLGMFTRSFRVMGTMERLLGGRVTHYHSKKLLKHPKQGGVWNWHQDYGYWYKDYFLTPDMATCYLAVDPQNEELNNGALQLLIGSHRMGRVDHWSKGDQQGADLERVELAKQRFENYTVDLEAGDAVFFSALTLHSSPGNLSETRRLAFASCFSLADNVQYKDAYIPCVKCELVADSALLGSRMQNGEPTLTSSEDKMMLSSEEGKKKARKADQN